LSQIAAGHFSLARFQSKPRVFHVNRNRKRKIACGRSKELVFNEKSLPIRYDRPILDIPAFDVWSCFA
jgi:hypothetical protein